MNISKKYEYKIKKDHSYAELLELFKAIVFIIFVILVGFFIAKLWDFTQGNPFSILFVAIVLLVIVFVIWEERRKRRKKNNP